MLTNRRGPASRSRRACTSCRSGHLKCDGERPCQQCNLRGISCDVERPAEIIIRQWQPGEVGCSSANLQDSLNRSQQSLSTGAWGFVDENSTVEKQYTILTGSPPVQTILVDHTTPLSTSSASPSAAMHLAPKVYNPPKADSSRRMAFFLDRYCHIIGPWFDLFDKERHFSSTVPHLSLTHEVLYLSCIACAARQHHLTSTENADTALSFYDEALQKLLASLEHVSSSSSAAIFASCLLLAHCEMIGASTEDWHLHLAGAYSLVSAHAFNGRTGGLGQASFWIYCRMDVLSSLAAAKPTRLDTSLWMPGPGLPRSDKEPWILDEWACHVVLLLAQVHNFLCEVRKTSTFSQTQFVTWQSLQAQLEQHEKHQPSECRPLITYMPAEKDETPFTVSLYSSETVSAAMQMFYLAHFLLIISRPERSSQDRADRFEVQGQVAQAYASRVVANSIGNPHSINWANAVQLLNIVGYVMTGWAERKSLLKCLEDIRALTGWNTRRNVTNLLDWWGWTTLLGLDGRSWRDISGDVTPSPTIKDSLLRFFNLNST